MSFGLGIGLKRTRRGGGAAPFDPTELPGYVDSPYSIAALRAAGALWQNTGKTVAAVADGDPIRVIDTGSIDLVAASDAARPLLAEIGGGLWEVWGDGVDDALQAAHALVQPYTRVIRSKIRLYGGVNSRDAILDGFTIFGGFLGMSDPALTLLFCGGVVSYAGIPTVDTYATVTIVVNGASSLIRIDGVEVASGNPGASNPAGTTIGAAANLTRNTDLSYAGLITCTGVLSGADLTNAEAYMSALS
jgi:hypothetical protein